MLTRKSFGRKCCSWSGRSAAVRDERFGPTLAAEHLMAEDALQVDAETLRRAAAPVCRLEELARGQSVGVRGTARQYDHGVRRACIALAAGRRTSATTGFQCTDRPGEPTGTDFGQETEVDAAAQP